MPYHVHPLYYAIDNWHQLPNARSNTDPSLRIRVTDFVDSDIFQAVRIQVVHPQYGILFSCITNATGRLVSWDDSAYLKTDQILAALRQLGFDVRVKKHPRLNNQTREYLKNARDLGFTHVRWVIKKVPFVKKSTLKPDRPEPGDFHRPPMDYRRERVVVCFNENKTPEFIKQYVPPIKISDWFVMEVSPNDNPNLDFSWLDVPMHIDSILTDNIKKRR